MKLHGFVNAGRLDSVDHCELFASLLFCVECKLFLPLAKPLQESILDSLSKPSVSVGMGIVYRLQGIRVEMNFGLPLTAAKKEGARKGFQLGLGLEFL